MDMGIERKNEREAERRYLKWVSYFIGAFTFVWSLLAIIGVENTDFGDIPAAVNVLARAALIGCLWCGFLRYEEHRIRNRELFWRLSELAALITGFLLTLLLDLSGAVDLVKYFGSLAAVAVLALWYDGQCDAVPAEKRRVGIIDTAINFILFGIAPQLVLSGGLVQTVYLLAIALLSCLSVCFLRVGLAVRRTGMDRRRSG